MDKKFLQYVIDKCETTINILSKQTGIKYQKLYMVIHYDRKLLNEELDKLECVLKRQTTLSENYIKKRIHKIKKRNDSQQ